MTFLDQQVEPHAREVTGQHRNGADLAGRMDLRPWRSAERNVQTAAKVELQLGHGAANIGTALAQGDFPIIKGLALTRDDLLRRAVIMALMCASGVAPVVVRYTWAIRNSSIA